MTRRRRRAEQRLGLAVLCRKFFGLTISAWEASVILSLELGSIKDLPEIVRKLRVLH